MYLTFPCGDCTLTGADGPGVAGICIIYAG